MMIIFFVDSNFVKT